MATKTNTPNTNKPAASSSNKKGGQMIRPLGDRVLVKRAEAEERTAGGILLPESAKDKPKEGTVIAIGAGKTLDSGELSKFSVAVGDRILFSSYAGTEVKYGGEEFLIMREEDILGIIG